MNYELCECCGKPKKKVVGTNPNYRPVSGKNGFQGESTFRQSDGMETITAPATPLAQAFAGHRYGLQALKPALEPIIVFQKPYKGKPIDNITRTGAGVLNIDKARIQHNEPIKTMKAQKDINSIIGQSGRYEDTTELKESGRWPANFYLMDKYTMRVYNLMDNLSQEIKTTIKEYYRDYSRMYSVWEVEEDLPIEIETKQREVLQSDLLCRMDEREPDWGKSPDDGEKANGRSAAQDERECAENALPTQPQELPERERMVLQQGLQACCIDGGGEGEVCINGEAWTSIEVERVICSRASVGSGAEIGEAVEVKGNGASYQRSEGRQPNRELRTTTEQSTYAGTPKVIQRIAKFTEGERRTARSNCFVAEIDIPEGWRKYFRPTNLNIIYDPVRRLDEQSGTLTSGARSGTYNGGGFMDPRPSQDGKQHGLFDASTGGASRFFFNVREQIDEADPVRYVAKASRRERDAGLDGMPLQRFEVHQHGMKLEKWDDGTLRERKTEPATARNPHPTVKPLALTRYLATLLLPPAEYAPRRLFVPFAGVASEVIGAMQAGWEEVEGVETTEEYIPIAQARVDYWKVRQLEFA